MYFIVVNLKGKALDMIYTNVRNVSWLKRKKINSKIVIQGIFLRCEKLLIM